MDDMIWIYTQTLRGMTPIQIETVAYILGTFAGKAGVPKEMGREIMHELLDEYMPKKIHHCPLCGDEHDYEGICDKCRALRGELK